MTSVDPPVFEGPFRGHRWAVVGMALSMRTAAIELFDEETKAQFEALIPRAKMGSPKEIATVALFLASDDSSYVNGMELIVDGGTSAI